MAPPDYTWFSLLGTNTSGFCNYGNRLIEACLRPLLGLEGRALTIDAFRPLDWETIKAINRTRYVAVPGCTAIQAGHNPAMHRLEDVRAPVYVFGGAFKAFGNREPSLDCVRGISRVIGARDSFTHHHLARHGFATRLIGCPTLWSGDRPLERRDGPIAFSFARARDENRSAQQELLAALKKRGEVVVLVHEDRDGRQWPLARERAVSLADPGAALDCLRRCAVVVTGRLHAVLPALANGVPAVFFTDVPDSRMRLLCDLGFPVHALAPGAIAGRLEELVAAVLAERETLRRNLALFRRRFAAYLTMFKTEVEG
jgi:hypothetical protein